jgi:hypothetical protein
VRGSGGLKPPCCGCLVRGSPWLCRWCPMPPSHCARRPRGPTVPRQARMHEHGCLIAAHAAATPAPVAFERSPLAEILLSPIRQDGGAPPPAVEEGLDHWVWAVRQVRGAATGRRVRAERLGWLEWRRHGAHLDHATEAHLAVAGGCVRESQAC